MKYNNIIFHYHTTTIYYILRHIRTHVYTDVIHALYMHTKTRRKYSCDGGILPPSFVLGFHDTRTYTTHCVNYYVRVSKTTSGHWPPPRRLAACNQTRRTQPPGNRLSFRYHVITSENCTRDGRRCVRDGGNDSFRSRIDVSCEHKKCQIYFALVPKFVWTAQSVVVPNNENRSKFIPTKPKVKRKWSRSLAGITKKLTTNTVVYLWFKTLSAFRLT